MIFLNNRFGEYLPLSLSGSSFIQFRIGLSASSVLTVDWGDGLLNSYSGTNITISHTYSSPYTGQIKVTCIGGNELITSMDSFDSGMVTTSIAFSINELIAFKNLVRFECTTDNAISGNVSLLSNLSNFNKLNIGNGSSLTGSVTPLTNLIYLRVLMGNSISGNFSGLVNLTYFEVTGSNTLTGSVTNLTLLTTLILISTLNNVITGSITNLSQLTRLQLGNSTNVGINTVNGNVDGLTLLTRMEVYGNTGLAGSISNLVNIVTLIVKGSNALGGSVTLLTSLVTLEVEGNTSINGNLSVLTLLQRLVAKGVNGLSGSTNALVNLRHIELEGLNTATSTNVDSLPNLGYIKNTKQVFTTSNVNDILAGIRLNLATSKLEHAVDIRGFTGSGAPSGQGIIDKAYLTTTASPVWSVLTR